MRILYYNWVDYLDDEKRGGGVSVYQRNLMREVDRRRGVEAMHLSSGISYDFRPAAPRWQVVRHGGDEHRGQRLEIVNSGTLSPSHYSFGDESQVHHAPTVEIFDEVLRETGPYDVVHFNNLEGLPADVLSLKERHPETRFVLSWHNYYPVCPQVNLWFQERVHCDDYLGGRRCTACLLGQPNPRLIRMAYAAAHRLKLSGIAAGTKAFDMAFLNALKAGKRAARFARGAQRARPRAEPAEADGDHFKRRRSRMIELINTHVDVVHCVSRCTGDIATRYGVDPDRIAVRYIGTDHSANWSETKPRERKADTPLKLVFLGYMRADKGFFFLLDALEQMPDDLLGRLDLLIAARKGRDDVFARLERLAPRMAGLRWQPGYDPDEMDTLLADRDLGVVPVLWEDNLPQVAIEMHARHLPLLVADRGGAQELANAPDFVFRSGDAADFTARLDRIVQGDVDMDAYWEGAVAPVSVADHLDDLLALYR